MSTTLPLHRGDVVLVDFPFSSGSGGKRRPALIVQNDQDNARQLNTIVAMITSNTAHVGGATQLLIDIATPDGRASGLRLMSAVKCSMLFTLEQRLIVQRIGTLPGTLMGRIDECLKEAVGVS
jgi:mRNA interferase MazF